MELKLARKKYIAEIVILCNHGIFSDQPDKIGAVRIYGGGGRAVLSLVERGRMLYDEYPEDCLSLGAAEEVVIEAHDRKSFSDVIFCLAKGNQGTLLASALEPDSTRDLLSRLQRYATRLVRVDVL